MSERSQLTRRAALKLGLGVGAAGLDAGLDGCGRAADRCGGGPVVGAPDGASATDAQRLLSGIDTIVVVMLENRSFDHLFGSLATDADLPRRPHDRRPDRQPSTTPTATGVPVVVNLAAGPDLEARSEARLGLVAPRLERRAKRRVRARERRRRPERGDELPPP